MPGVVTIRRRAMGRESRTHAVRATDAAAVHTPPKEVPTLRAFAPRFMDGHARANRQKPSGIATKERILRVHLLPALGHRKLDAIKSEDVQRLKCALQAKSPKTVNNVLAVLSVLLKKAVEWEVIERMPCTVKLLPVPKGSAAFYDFDQYERLIEVARAQDARTHLIVLLGGEAGLRVGEMMALEWGDVDLANRQLCIARSDWNGFVTTPKGGRLRRVPLTRRLAAALSAQRHLRSARVLCQDDGDAAHAAVRAGEDEAGVTPGGAAARRAAHPAALVLFAPGDAGRTRAGDSGARRAQRSDDDAALHAPHAGGARCGDPAARTAERARAGTRIRTQLWRHCGNTAERRR